MRRTTGNTETRSNLNPFAPIWNQNMTISIRTVPNHHREVPGESKMNLHCQEIIIFKNFKPTKIHQEVPENTLRRPKIHQSVSRQIDPGVFQRWSKCVKLVMVRSTLRPLRLRGSLRAKSGGPPVTVFFVVQTNVCGIKLGSRIKSFIVSKVSSHEKSDGNHDFDVRPRGTPKHDQFSARFGTNLELKHDNSNQNGPKSTQRSSG